MTQEVKKAVLTTRSNATKPCSELHAGGTTAPQATQPTHGFTFVVGVIGHRDFVIDSEADLERLIDGFLTNLRVLLGPVPMAIACGMADGADRFVAHRALNLGIPVRAILPMPKEYYLSDFGETSAEELRDLLGRESVSVEQIPLPPDADPEVFMSPGVQRDRLYWRLGDCLSRRSNILLALWDGVAERPQGGTADVLLHYLSGPNDHLAQNIGVEKSAGATLRFLNDGNLRRTANLAVWIEVGRQPDQSPRHPILSYLGATSDPSVLLRKSEMPQILRERLTALRGYYCDWTALRERGKAPPAWSLVATLSGEPPPDIAALLTDIDVEYQRADGLAVHNQARSDRIFRSFGFLAGGMGLLFLLYAKIAALNTFLIAYLALFAGGYTVFKLAQRRHWLSRHLLYRAIAETMRVNFYVVLSGGTSKLNVQRLLSLTGIESFVGFALLNDLMRTAQPLSRDERAPQREILSMVKRGWIDDQSSYFQRKIHDLSRNHHMLECVKKMLFALSFISVLALLFFKYQMTSVAVAEHLDFKTLLVFLMGLLPLWLGIWEIYQNKMATRELLWQYQNHVEHFKAAAEAANADIPAEAVQSVFAILGERSLFESYLWTIHRYHREFEPPSAG
jgi:hypothetical protein